MEKIQINDQFKEDYKKLIQTAQNIESAIGSAYVKLNKMVEVRRQVDTDLKSWWDAIAREYKIDTKKDYYVDSDIAVNVVERKAPQTPTEDVVDPDAEPVETLSNEEAQAMIDSGEATIPEEAVVVAEEADNKEGGTTEDLT